MTFFEEMGRGSYATAPPSRWRRTCPTRVRRAGCARDVPSIPGDAAGVPGAQQDHGGSGPLQCLTVPAGSPRNRPVIGIACSIATSSPVTTTLSMRSRVKRWRPEKSSKALATCLELVHGNCASLVGVDESLDLLAELALYLLDACPISRSRRMRGW